MTPEEASTMHYSGAPLEFDIPEGVEGPVYCVGDSHVYVLQNVCPKIFKPNHWSFEDSETVFLPKSVSKTAYAIGSSGHDDYIVKSYASIPHGSKVLVSFGEIDCRHYIPRFARQNGDPIEDLVLVAIERFKSQCLSAFREKYRLMALGIYMTIDDRSHEGWCDDILCAKFIMNQKLQAFCEEAGCLFVNLFDVSQAERWNEHPQGTYFGDSSHASGCMVPTILNAMAGFKWKGFDE